GEDTVDDSASDVRHGPHPRPRRRQGDGPSPEVDRHRLRRGPGPVLRTDRTAELALLGRALRGSGAASAAAGGGAAGAGGAGRPRPRPGGDVQPGDEAAAPPGPWTHSRRQGALSGRADDGYGSDRESRLPGPGRGIAQRRANDSP